MSQHRSIDANDQDTHIHIHGLLLLSADRAVLYMGYLVVVVDSLFISSACT